VASKGKRRFNAPRGPAKGGADMMKQIEALQSQMAEAQASLEQEVVTASVGGGAVTIEMTGAQEVKTITIRPDVVDAEDVEMLQDLILAAFAEAQQKVQQLTQERMSPFTAGLDIPGLM
jgi:nucleoid-associated protein EbfC